MITILISGGMDSFFSLILLKILNYKIKTVYIMNWIILKKKNIINIIFNISKILNIVIIFLNFKVFYKKKIFLKFLKNYNKNTFINLDFECNKLIKFNFIFKYLEKILKNFKICSGHYLRLSLNNKNFFKKKSIDLNRDQNYFLNNIKSDFLKKLIFPLGLIYKINLKKIFIVYFKIRDHYKSSKGICFFENKNMNLFLKNYIYKKIKFNKYYLIKFNLINKIKKILIIKLNFKIKSKYYKYLKCKIKHSKTYFLCFLRKVNKKIFLLNLINNKILYSGQNILLIYKERIIENLEII